MQLYRVHDGDEDFYVEAKSYQHCVALWRKHLIDEGNEGMHPNDEPDSIAVVHPEPVIREVLTNA